MDVTAHPVQVEPSPFASFSATSRHNKYQVAKDARKLKIKQMTN